MKWTDELDNRVACLLRAKKTASEIGAAMGITRNAVIGRVARCAMLKEIGFARKSGDSLGIPRLRVKTSFADKCRMNNLGYRVRAQRAAKPKAAKKPVIVKPVLVAPIPFGLTLMELGPHQCRFCINEPEKGAAAHLFCGEVTEPGKSWCAWHETIVWGRGTAAETATVKSAGRIAA